MHQGFITGLQSGNFTSEIILNLPTPSSYNPADFPGFGLEDGPYCRNPDKDDKPWCYTQFSWEYCEVPTCGM